LCNPDGQKAHQILISLDKLLVNYLASVDLACTEMGGLFHDGVCPTAEQLPCGILLSISMVMAPAANKE
jgi:hypothetical protein